MQLEEAQAAFAANGISFTWRSEDDPPGTAFLRSVANVGIEIAPNDVVVVIPDVHLGWGNDVFRYCDPQRERVLESFFDGLAKLAKSVRLDVVQLGDWYDFWRSPGTTAGAAKAIIESSYPGVVERARALGVRHCIGNHDAAFADPQIRAGLDVEIVRAIGDGNRVLCFHGHDTVALSSIAVDGTATSIGLNILNVLNTVVPVVGALASFVQRAADGSFAEPLSPASASKPWPRAKVPGSSGWAAPWVARDPSPEESAANVGGCVSGFEQCVGHEVQLVFVGHSHRPGISWCPAAGRRVPLIDVGSWTYGRTEFAVVCANGVGLARLQ